jgi:hypothetical protein
MNNAKFAEDLQTVLNLSFFLSVYFFCSRSFAERKENSLA